MSEDTVRQLQAITRKYLREASLVPDETPVDTFYQEQGGPPSSQEEDIAGAGGSQAYKPLVHVPPLDLPETVDKLTITGVTCSDEQGDKGNYAKNVIDGDPKSRWSAKGDQWIELDLGVAQEVHRLNIAFYDGANRKYLYELFGYGPDNKTLIRLGGSQSSGKLSEGSLEAVSFATPVLTKAIRYVGHGNNLNTWNSILEMQLEGKLVNEPGPKPEPEPEPEPIPEPEPKPEEPGTIAGVLYDSNKDIDWAAITGEYLKVTNIYGEFKPNTKYFRTKASGSPRAFLYPKDKTIKLQHDGKYGRLYFGVCNYACIIELEFMLDSCNNKLSLKSRCRHQYHDVVASAKPEQCQGGQGGSYGCGELDADLEIYHGGGEVSGPSAKLVPKLEAKKWYKAKFSQFDKDGKIHIIQELDRNDGKGYKVVNEGDTKAPRQFFDKDAFNKFSEFWVRYNADQGGELTFKNLLVTAI
jgi:F5/8 type C domain